LESEATDANFVEDMADIEARNLKHQQQKG